MFSEFNTVTKEEWLAKVEKDLKGKKSIESFNWELDGMTFTPFYHSDDNGNEKPLANGKANNSWEIGERIVVFDFKAANEQALVALSKGANALLFVLKGSPSFEDLNILLNDIQLEWISTHFNVDVFGDFIKIIQSKNQNPAEINCSFSLGHIAPVLEDCVTKLPKGRFIPVNVIDNENSLVEAIKEGNDILESINEAGLDIKKYHHQIQFSISLNDNYFASIAKIRALKLLWQNVLTAWDKDLVANSPIEVHLTTNSQTEDENTNKIKATTQAMSAVIGGADRLYIYPSDSSNNENGTNFSRRIALNVHHLMEQESYLDKVIDPSAGSYFIEHLTNSIAEKSWDSFVIGD